MPKMRQKLLTGSDLEDLLDIRSYAVELSIAHKIHKHSHNWHQLIYASRGVMTVNTSSGSWVVPSRRAVWVPAGIEHEVEMSASVSVRTLYLRPGLSEVLPKNCCVVNVSPLLRELILRTVEIGMLNRNVASHKHLIDVILDQFLALPTVPLNLPMPADIRAVRIAEIVRENPGDAKSLDHLAKRTGASKRTIERLFQTETEMSFGKGATPQIRAYPGNIPLPRKVTDGHRPSAHLTAKPQPRLPGQIGNTNLKICQNT